MLLEILLKISSCKTFVAGGALKSHFLFYLQSETEMFAQNCSSCPSKEINQTQSSFGHDETQAERDQSEVRLQIAAEQKRTPDRSSCRRVMPEPPAKKLLAKSAKNVSSFPKKEAKTAGVVIAGLHPLLRQTANHRTRTLKKAAWCNQTVKYILRVSGKMHILCCLSALNMPQLLMQDQAG